MNRFLKLIVISCLGLATATHAATFTVNMSGFQFVPKDLTVNVGDTVTWVNRDGSAHDAVSGVNLVPSGVWRSPLFGRNGSYSFTFNVPVGTYPYYCTPHVFSFNMVGTITVVAPNAPPTITITNPQNNSSLTAGANLVILADARDDNGVARVEFYRDGNLIVTDFSAPYSATLNNLTAGNYSLTAKAFDIAGLSTTSTSVNISVRDAATAPIILTQPQSQNVFPGSEVNFSVTAIGTPPLSYQWQFNGANIMGATTNSLFLGNVQTNNAGSYSVVVSNEAGSTPSDSAILNVTKLPNIPPTITLVEPVDGARFRVGSDIAVRAMASDNDGQIVQVKFLLNGFSFATLTNAPYEIVLTNLPPDLYFIVARATDNDGGFTSSTTVSFSVLASPTIVLTEPADESRVALGSNVLIAATVGAPGLMVDHVQFFEGFGNSFVAISPALTNPPYSFNWTPSAAGIHTVMAVVTDELGGTAGSQMVSIDVFEPGTQNPTIAITSSPPNFARLTNSPVFIGGTANDDVLLERVEFQVNGGPFVRASGTTNWLAEVSLAAGTNAIIFRSVDFAGNFSPNITRAFIYEVNSPLAVKVGGVGRVQPNLDGKLLKIGNVYQMIARPGAGQIFGGWEGAAVSNKAVLNFTMQSNLVLTANFILNPFTTVKGKYSGLIFDTNGVNPESSGMIKLNVTGQG
ncbi:MAG: Ig-like domain-containing protein, partial [Verrucomicrobiota bacterium]